MPTYVKLLGSLVMLAISGLAALYEHSVADQLARRAVLHPLDGEDGVLAHPGRQLLVLGRAPRRQQPQHRALHGQRLGHAH
jgi:hypothetical protein